MSSHVSPVWVSYYEHTRVVHTQYAKDFDSDRIRNAYVLSEAYQIVGCRFEAPTFLFLDERRSSVLNMQCHLVWHHESEFVFGPFSPAWKTRNPT